MTGYVVDASVAVKWLVTEPFSDRAEQLLDADLMLIAPELLFAELRMHYGPCAGVATSPKRTSQARWMSSKEHRLRFPSLCGSSPLRHHGWQSISIIQPMIVSTSPSPWRNTIP